MSAPRGSPGGALLSVIARALLRWPALRRRLAFELRQGHFAALDLRIPIGGGLVCPLHGETAALSFGEIFCEREYAPLFARLPAPARWLDLGAHAGFFTLQAAAHAAPGWSALLVEPDPRLAPAIDRLVALNAFGPRVRLLRGVVGPAGPSVSFALRYGMASAADTAAADTHVTVPVISEAELLAALPPPYDLVKLDIEGAEFEFVRRYPRVCAAARAVVAEWHAPAADDPRVAAFRAALAAHGLDRATALRPPHTTNGVTTGLELFERPPAA